MPNRVSDGGNGDLSGLRQVEALVEILVQLSSETDPAKGDQGSIGKDQKAAYAISLAGRLVEELAGWAIDHNAGLAAGGLNPVPSAPSSVRDRDDYAAARQEVDDHRHELEGARLRQRFQSPGAEPLPPETARVFLANVLRSAPFGPDRRTVTSGLSEALDALSHGETTPLLTGAKTHRKVGLRERKMQIVAVGLIHYRRARGKKAISAIQEVATAYGVGWETMKSWEHHLRKEIPLEVVRAIAIAKHVASLDEERIKAGYRGEETHIPHHDAAYGTAALRTASEKFKSLQRE